MPDLTNIESIKLISVDMFRTLVDLESTEQIIWHKVLGNKYTDSLAKECSSHIGNQLLNYVPLDKYLSLKSVFVLIFTDVFPRLGIGIDPKKAALLWAQLHPESKPFHDTIPFLKAIGKRYPVCLASDADDDMLGKLKQMYNFDYIFTSEQLRLYKSNVSGVFFKSIAEHYKYKPEEIIHVGDGKREIISANNAGMVTCWLNRTNMIWSHEIAPNYTASSLIDVATILGIKVE